MEAQRFMASRWGVGLERRNGIRLFDAESHCSDKANCEQQKRCISTPPDVVRRPDVRPKQANAKESQPKADPAYAHCVGAKTMRAVVSRAAKRNLTLTHY